MVSPIVLALALFCGSEGLDASAPPPDSLGESPTATPNRLAGEASDYLRMHASNPVDWYPWGDEAFARARAEDKPIFLSIGYASCHWCHVMEEESFADPTTAELMNRLYVSIKVDREERPDVDAIYMRAIHMMGHDGGWPASLWLTPDGVPFYVGTYFPPEPARGRPGFKEVLTRMATLWTQERARVMDVADKVAAGLQTRTQVTLLEDPLPDDTPQRAVQQAWQGWDPIHAGWGQGTKFPSTPKVQWLLDHAVLTGDAVTIGHVRELLDAMARLGLRDHVGGGFHRYCVDVRWTVPHFEKMLYDNAQLLGLYAQAAVAFDEPRYAAVARDTAAWMLRELRAPGGGFMAALDADDPGGEGAYYTWTPSELTTVLGQERGDAFAAAYWVTPQGNFDHGRTVLRRLKGDWDDPALAADRRALLAARTKRPAPPTDTLQVVAWNGLAISALARAGRLLALPELIAAARGAAEQVLAAQSPDGGLPRTLAPDSPPGVIDDYAMVAGGLLDLYEASGSPRWLHAADRLAAQAVRRFQDPATGALDLSEDGRHDLILTHRRYEAGAEPSGAGRLLTVLERLRGLGSATGAGTTVARALATAGQALARAPSQVPDFVAVLQRYQVQGLDAVLASTGPDDPTLAPFLAIWDARVFPHGMRVVTQPGQDLSAFGALANKAPSPDGTRAYVCWDGVCKRPTDDPETFAEQLRAGPRSR